METETERHDGAIIPTDDVTPTRDVKQKTPRKPVKVAH